MLKQRIITAFFLLAGVTGATTLLPAFYFAMAISIVLLLAAYEWSNLIGIKTTNNRWAYVGSMAALIVGGFLLLGIRPGAESLRGDHIITLMVLGLLFWCLVFYLLWGYPENRMLWNDESKIALMGVFALLPVWAGVIQLKYFQSSGVLVLALILLVSSVDIGAYFAGVSLGRRKLAPKLSPKKTWEGFWGGVAACVLTAAVFIAIAFSNGVHLPPLQVFGLMMVAALVALFGVVGDLFESMLKRNQDLKDSGKLLPGHGGLLDRIDSLIAATPLFVVILSLLFTDTILH